MSITTIAWAAGIFEGEGSVARRSVRSAAISVHQKDEWILLKLKSIFGGYVNRFPNSRGRSGCSRWTINGARARGFLLTIFSFLSPRRRKQIRDCVEFKKCQ